MIRKLFPLLIVSLVAGCGYDIPQAPATVKVTGKVQLPGGAPLTVGTIRFEPTHVGKGVDAYAQLERDGSFTLKSFGDKEGVKPGSYVAYLDPATLHVYDSSSKQMVVASSARSIPVTYLQAATTRWKFEITENTGNLGTLKAQ